MRGNRATAHAALVGLVECARGALLFTLLPNHLRFGVGHGMSVVGLTLSVYYLSELALKVPSGWLVDRWGRRLPVVAGLSLTLLATLLFAQVEAVWGLLLAAAVGGAGASPVWPAVVSGVADATEEGGRGSAMGAVFTSWLVGTGLGFVLANFLLEVHTAAAFGLVAACQLAALPLAGRLEARSRGHVQQELRESVHDVELTAGRLWPLVAGMAAQTLAMGMLVPTLSPYAREVLKLTPLWIGVLLLAGPGLTVLLLVPLGRLIDRLDRLEVLPMCIGAGAAVLFVLPFFRSLWILIPLVAILGLGYATMLPAWNALLMDLLPPARRATLLGLAMSVEGAGVALGTALGGVLWDAVGPSAPFHAAGLFLFLVAVNYLMLLPRSLEPLLRRKSARGGWQPKEG
ncbi:MAG: MFS transporter [Armatimonadota bacterium]|nr:MFS transporter [Armatimonadota bacterium]MDR5674879.1 MFS transporter [Armatimonadota bacterium]MDR5688340.1 MFS transporter [Armatimonadota bacterium]MDR7388247.1 MFS transporter [Armatimonadota bacterium]MDR7391744.1 MFS transporter [Armatimonadota bacterium]